MPTDDANDLGRERLVEGGEVSANETGDDIEVGIRKAFARRQGVVTYLLIALLALLIACHIGAIILFTWNGKETKALQDAFNAAFPALVSFVGAAVAFHFKLEGK